MNFHMYMSLLLKSITCTLEVICLQSSVLISFKHLLSTCWWKLYLLVETILFKTLLLNLLLWEAITSQVLVHPKKKKNYWVVAIYIPPLQGTLWKTKQYTITLGQLFQHLPPMWLPRPEAKKSLSTSPISLLYIPLIIKLLSVGSQRLRHNLVTEQQRQLHIEITWIL